MRCLAAELEACKQRVDGLLTELLDQVELPPVLRKAALHLLKAGGKRLRPFVALKACELVGGQEGHVLPTASALELLHTFTLIHDDIMDRDERRRGVSAVHVVWGVPMAIDAGDLLFAMVYHVIVERTPESVPREKLLQVIGVIAKAAIAICKGQALDLSFAERREAVTEDEYFKMISLKTAALYEASATSGAILGGADEDSVERLRVFGRNFGLAFQIRDDVLGLIGKERQLGKPVGSDLKEGKSTILVIHALRTGAKKEREAIQKVLGNPNATDGQVAQAIEAIRATGAFEHAKKLSIQFVQKAKAQLDAFPEVTAKRALLELADFVIVREF